jgi:hypothetical protein
MVGARNMPSSAFAINTLYPVLMPSYIFRPYYHSWFIH